MLINKKILVMDISNILFSTFHASEYHLGTSRNAGDEEGLLAHETSRGETTKEYQLIALAMHMALNKCNKYRKKFQPFKIVFCFDGRGNWRKIYTKSSKCISKRPYKGNRRKNMTEKQEASYEVFKEFAGEFEQVIRDHTSIVCCAGKGLEADDLIGGICDTFADDNDIVIISSDKDMLQLLKHERVTLINPTDDKARSLAKWDNDPKYFLFEKCIRGDSGDNVMSAYPRVRETRIKQAYTDAFHHANMMNTTWKLADVDTEEEREVRVGDLFKENQLLMDLSMQPPEVRELINIEISDAFENPGAYDPFRLKKFLGKYKLKEIIRNLEHYKPMFMK